jgi:DUF1707 SHOCT-like domain
MGDLEGWNAPGDLSRMRISDADRHRVAEVLRQAAGEGRLDFDDLDERLELTFSAKTYADLVPITADLHAVTHAPAADSPVPLVGGVPAVGHASSTAILGDRKRRGVWQVPAHHSAFTLMGSITLDLREAVLVARETTINANAIMGEIKIITSGLWSIRRRRCRVRSSGSAAAGWRLVRSPGRPCRCWRR